MARTKLHALLDWPTRFLRKRRLAENGCWIWTGSLFNTGYGAIWKDGRMRTAHSLSYETFVGPVPSGMEIDHLCGNRACLNPEHLEAVTTRENQLRSNGVGGVNARKKACPQGHPYDETNTLLYQLRTRGPNRYQRLCRTCQAYYRSQDYKMQRKRG